MADRVIVVGASRGRQRIPVAEIKQMMGRAGRTHDGSVCVAEIVVSMEEEEYVTAGLEEDEGLDVQSVLGSMDIIVFHAMPEVSSGRIRDRVSAAEWFDRSFCRAQGGSLDVNELFDYLENMEAAKVSGDRITSTAMGDLASSFYFHPADVLAWRMNFTKLFDEGLENDEVGPAWALGNVPVKRMSGHFGKHGWVIEECMNKMPRGLFVQEGCVINTTLWWHCMGGPPVGGMKGAAMALRDDFSRIRAMLGVMNAKVAGWDRSEWLDGLEARVRAGLVPWLVPLYMLPGMNKSRALYLYNIGVRTSEDLDEDLVRSMEDEVDKDFMDAVRRLV
jgi:hypothetical protein